MLKRINRPCRCCNDPNKEGKIFCSYCCTDNDIRLSVCSSCGQDISYRSCTNCGAPNAFDY